MISSRLLLVVAFVSGLIVSAVAQGEEHEYPAFPYVGAAIALVVCAFFAYRWPLTLILLLPVAFGIYVAHFFNLIDPPCMCYPTFEYAPPVYRSLVVGYPVVLGLVSMVAVVWGVVKRRKAKPIQSGGIETAEAVID